MIEALANVVGWVSILTGLALLLAGGLGILRMPDLYTRLHAASVTDTGATMLIILGLFVQAIFIFGNVMAAVKLLLVLFFTLFTAPTASHALAKTALAGGLVPTDKNGKPLLASPEHARQMADTTRPDPAQ